MKHLTVWVLALGVGMFGAGCLKYGSNGNENDRCQTVADCNPGRTCGDMVPCVDGDCVVGQTIPLPCEQGCENDADCPAGMHCRFANPGNVGECVADGTCLAASECAGLGHDDCEGVFECIGGACRFSCLGERDCRNDGDCVLADRGCCCGFDVDDYVAIHEDLIDEWQTRPECWVVDCPGVLCTPPEDLRAVCLDGGCQVDEGPVESECERDADCVKVAGDCCGCEIGGLEGAVPVGEREAYLAELQEFCARVDIDCGGHDACTDRPAVCREGRCEVQGAWCDCPQGVDDWDPVCAGTGAMMMTLPNACVADCLGIPWSYPGRCDCMMDCLISEPVCAENRQTYWCGPLEAECSGQAVIYPGECDDACEPCLLDGRPPIPVCGTDFFDWPDVCLAECHDVSWWHEGACLDGEGAMCGGIGGLICVDAMECIYDVPVPDSLGVCIERGHCQAPVDCEYQYLTHDDCAGGWTCPQHTCTWECDP